VSQYRVTVNHYFRDLIMDHLKDDSVTRNERQLKMHHPVPPSAKEQFPGQFEGQRVVDWLNAEPETPEQSEQQEHVITLLRLLAESVDAQNATGSSDAFRQYNAARPFYDRIAMLLSRYSYTPDLRLTWQGNPLSTAWKLSQLPAGWDCDDYRAVLAIAQLIQHGRFRAIRQCDGGCGRWLFATKESHSTCSARCRATKKRKSLSVEQIEERREKARARYHFNKLKSSRGEQRQGRKPQ
jgi:hypothetical protein